MAGARRDEGLLAGGVAVDPAVDFELDVALYHHREIGVCVRL